MSSPSRPRTNTPEEPGTPIAVREVLVQISHTLGLLEELVKNDTPGNVAQVMLQSGFAALNTTTTTLLDIANRYRTLHEQLEEQERIRKAAEQPLGNIPADVKRLKEADVLKGKIINALPGNKHDPKTEVERLTKVDILQKKVLEILPDHEHDLDTEVARLKTANTTLNQIKDTLKLDSGLDLVTEIGKHRDAQITLTEIENKLVPGEQSTQEKIDKIKSNATTCQADLEEVDAELELEGRERVSVIRGLQNDLKTAQDELHNIRQKLLPESEFRNNVDAIAAIRENLRKAGETRDGWRREYTKLETLVNNINHALPPSNNHTQVFVINQLKTDLSEAESNRDQYKQAYRRNKASLEAINQALPPPDGRTAVELIEAIRRALGQHERDIEDVLDQIGKPGLTLLQAVTALQTQLTAQNTEFGDISAALVNAFKEYDYDPTRVTPAQAIDSLAFNIFSIEEQLQDVEADRLNAESQLDQVTEIAIGKLPDGQDALDYSIYVIREHKKRHGSANLLAAINKLQDQLNDVHAAVRDPLFVAYSRWFASLDGQLPSTLPRVIVDIQQNITVQTVSEPGTSRLFYCNVMSGYHLLAHGNTLVLVDEASLSLSALDRLITFQDNQIARFVTNLRFTVMNPVIRTHMRGLWLRCEIHW